MTTADQATSIPTSRKVVCIIYGAISVAALIATWSQNVAYFDHGGRFFLDFMNDLKVTPASRSFFADFLMFGLAVLILMVLEARKHGVKFVWLYIAVGQLTGVSVTFPLFLIARELRMGTSDVPRLRATDTILLVVAALLVVGQVIWADMG
jgi:hypothetical protein